jgi:hypothetical protein
MQWEDGASQDISVTIATVYGTRGWVQFPEWARDVFVSVQSPNRARSLTSLPSRWYMGGGRQGLCGDHSSPPPSSQIKHGEALPPPPPGAYTSSSCGGCSVKHRERFLVVRRWSEGSTGLQLCQT